ncbi:PREDICTED: uncharacterized protein LOC105448491 [Wasmannia auropunctata]|uniref:uncharacterized protein LOC105448491 n=1 Tax=Wasmannia auropunctata TaxID=64793 RepID=UPI0005EDF32C|nr:PREDICTED: uncharacterized protein LOC105448491 [Wasmannia auropunctata]
MPGERSPTRGDEEILLQDEASGGEAIIGRPQLSPATTKATTFNVVEATFALNRITGDETKFRHILSNLDPQTIPFVADLITDPPGLNKYEAIKKRIIDTFGEFQETKLRKLLRDQERGDDKPSHYLQRLRNLAGSNCTDSVIRSLFLEQLPEGARSILAVSPTEDLDTLAIQADRIIDAIKPQVSAIQAKNDANKTSSTIEAEICELRRKVEKLSAQLRRSRSKSRGSDISVLPKSWKNRDSSAANFSLYAANGSKIHVYGSRELELNLGLRRSFNWKFTIAEVATPLLGADFLYHYNLLDDLRNKKLVDGLTDLKVEGKVTNIRTQSVSTLKQQDTIYTQILKEFINVTRPSPQRVNKHKVEHHIVTNGSPISDRARRLPPEKLKFAKQEIESWIKNSDCQPGSGQWANAMHMVDKKDGTWRICEDYRRPNKIRVPDRYPISHLQDFSHKLHGFTIFSRLDLTRAYHQIPMAAGDKEKTALITPFGLYEFNIMPFGLRNAAQTFQRFRDTIGTGTPTKQVLQKLREYGLSINTEKCALGQAEVQQLVRFLPWAAKIQATLHVLISGIQKKDKRPLQWNEQAEKAVEECKSQLAEATLLAHPAEDVPLILSTDASDYAIGTVLEQEYNSKR